MARRLKIDKDEEIQEGEVVEREWDIKKIGIGLFIFALIIIFASYLFLPRAENSASTLGVSTATSPTPPLPKKEDIQKVIENAKSSLSQITADNLTSSQAAVQQIISDLQNLQGKEGAVGLFCKMVCSDK